MPRTLRQPRQSTGSRLAKSPAYALIPAFNEFPIINVVHPAYHALPNGGQPSFLPSGNRRLSCVLVFATVDAHGQGTASIHNWRRAHTFCRICDCCGRFLRQRHSFAILTSQEASVPISTAPAEEPAIIERKALGWLHRSESLSLETKDSGREKPTLSFFTVSAVAMLFFSEKNTATEYAKYTSEVPSTYSMYLNRLATSLPNFFTDVYNDICAVPITFSTPRTIIRVHNVGGKLLYFSILQTLYTASGLYHPRPCTSSIAPPTFFSIVF